MKRFQKGIILLAVIFLLATPLTAAAAETAIGNDLDYVGYQKTDPAAMLVDLITTRPIGVASIAVGTATYVVSLPFSLLGGNAGAAFNRLIALPFGYTFSRPLGDI